ncbi:MAG TPA: YdeI/OmpD-associated family protein [Allosphingosinicella sp.]|jgi:uncharacterized protein YdeI (YjbR/CyaY-like superfamily)|nr:YdeI/OmpD-associated family protein [Allosphingosinicella sp.]
MTPDPRVDAYIARQADFARPILEHLRAAVGAACPEAEEAIKWGMPHFLHEGRILAFMAAFKAHAGFGFREGSVVGEGAAKADAMGQFGKLRGIGDLPAPEALAALIRKAMAASGASDKRPRAARPPKPEIETPPDLAAALDAAPAARAAFDAFPPSCRREYVEWIVDAKRPETRARRLAQAAEWIAEGKRRNWKYENC